LIPIYEPLEVVKCEKSGKVVVKLKELTEFWKKHQLRIGGKIILVVLCIC
jgi:hypothetical protein